MWGTSKADLAGLVKAGVFEPARGRFSREFGGTGCGRLSADRTRPPRAWSGLRPPFQNSEASTKRTPQNSSFESRSRVSEVEVSTGDRGVSQGRAARGRLFGLSLPRHLAEQAKDGEGGLAPTLSRRDRRLCGPRLRLRSSILPLSSRRIRSGWFHEQVGSSKSQHPKTRPHSFSKKHAADGF